MEFARIKTPGIAHNAYVIGTQGIGIIIDPRRDINEYLAWAIEKKLSIKYVLQTHRQEDFVLGSTAFKKLGATIVAGAHSLSKYADKQMKDGETLEIGELIIKTLQTPGHTPESVSYVVTMKEHPDKPWAVFTGDALFIGETGRTDLPDPNKTAENAGILYDGIHKNILSLGDHVHIYPAHGSGSVCGGNIAKYDESTIGFERTYNPVFLLSKSDFVTKKLHERLPRPPYFKNIEKINLKGGSLLEKDWHSVQSFSAKEFSKKTNEIIIDTRLPESFSGGHIPGSYGVWLQGLPVFGGWIAWENKPVFLVLEKNDDLEKAFQHLTRIGIDNIAGFLTGGFEAWRNAGLPVETSGIITPKEFEKSPNMSLLDVREITEYEDKGHVKSAYHVYTGYIPDCISTIKKNLDKDENVVVTCSVGNRANLAVSMLKKEGYKNVSNLIGGMNAWSALRLPLENTVKSKLVLDQKRIEKDFPSENENM